MILWRVSEFVELDGEGGKLFKGRWHRAGRPVVYTAEHSALALLEILAQWQRRVTPPPFQLLEIDAPDDLGVTPFNERVPPASQDVSRSWGEAWLVTGATAIARVPSSLAPHANNYLINPNHCDAARIKVVRHARYQWDSRLFASAR